jgi:V/A-type H+/Na+-transporting ATPase subunit I
MFYPQEMTEIELIVPAKDIVAVTKALGGRGVFQQTDSNYLSSEIKQGSTNVWQERAAAYAGLERRIQNIIQTLGVEEGQPPAAELGALVDIETVRPVIEQIELEVKKVSDQLSAENKHLEQLQSTIKQLEPVADIEFDLGAIRNSHFLYSHLGIIPLANIERLQTSLSHVPFVLLTLRQDNHEAVVWLAGAKNNQDVLERAARSAYLNPLTVPDAYKGTPTEIIVSLQNSIKTVQQNIDALKQEIVRLNKKYEKQLQGLIWDVRSTRMLADAIVRYGRLKYTYLVVGWAITSQLAGLTRQIQQLSKETLVETYPTQRSGVNQNVPSSLDHPGIMRPFQMLVTTFGQPRYGELDPTLLMMLMFPFLFGAMFGDVGQGVVLALLGWLLISKKVKALRGMASLGGVILACGAVATVFGFLYGSFFGFEDIIEPLWMSPVKNILTILMIAIVAGVILLSLGFILGIINAWTAHNWSKLFFDHSGISGLVLYWSLLGLGAAALLPNFPVPQFVFIFLAVVAGVAVAFSEVWKHLLEGHRPLIEDSIGIYLIQVFFEMFETVISYLSNSLSYVRVGAFAVAHGGLSAAIFVLAELVGADHGFGYWVTIVLGNVFIVGFEGLIVGIQTMRLSYYEFFSKFFTGGGMKYEPLSIRPVNE